MSELDNVLYVRDLQKKDETTDSDITDPVGEDNGIIINTYNEMTKVSHVDIAKKIAASTSRESNIKQNKEPVDKNSDKSEDDSTEDRSHDFDIVDDVPVWEIGCDCRVTYKEDQIDYEATIIDIYHDYTCLVEFVGYGNQQIEDLEKLLPSWGISARKEQIKESEQYHAKTEMGDLADKKDKSKSHQKTQNKVYERTIRNNQGSDMFGPGLLPPQPPLPPMLANGGPMDDPEQNDALSAMLMSWYMSGYYTGLYHGQLKGKKK